MAYYRGKRYYDDEPHWVHTCDNDESERDRLTADGYVYMLQLSKGHIWYCDIRTTDELMHVRYCPYCGQRLKSPEELAEVNNANNS